MSTQPQVRQATSSEYNLVRGTVTLAFAADPFNRWYLLDADSYLKYFPKVVDAFLAASIDAGTCYVTDGCTGAAIWFPPGVTGNEAEAEAVFAEAVPPQLAETFGKLLGAFEAFHPHDDDCWYLPLIGVDPAHQSKGIGGALMKHAAKVVDERGALSYLEASSAQNAALYARYGFETIEELQIDDSPVVRPMVRARRS